jgi:hypothetical protein
MPIAFAGVQIFVSRTTDAAIFENRVFERMNIAVDSMFNGTDIACPILDFHALQDSGAGTPHEANGLSPKGRVIRRLKTCQLGRSRNPGYYCPFAFKLCGLTALYVLMLLS